MGTTKPKNTSVPVRGPDDAGDEKHWMVAGMPGEQVQVQLEASKGFFSVTVISRTFGAMTWEGGQELPSYHVIGSHNGWTPGDLMTSDKTAYAVFLYRLCVGDDSIAEEFQILVDGAFSRRLHPAAANA